MNTQELREMKKKEIADLWKKMATSEDDLSIWDQIEEVQNRYRILIMENDIVRNWGFPPKEWAKLSQEAKRIIVDMDAEAQRYEQLRQDLQEWIDQAP